MELTTCLNELFPFHIQVDRDNNIQFAGKSMLKVYPDIEQKSFFDHFSILRPQAENSDLFDDDRLNFLTILRCNEHGYIFRGQFYKVDEETRYFLCNPWVTNANELLKMGVKLNDFPIYDQTGDLILAINQEEIRTNDITELTDILGKINTRLKLAKEEAEASLEVKSAFLANMSHEIRTPMNAILGLSKLIDEDHLNEKEKEFLNAIQSSANNLLTIINDILDFSKIQADKMDVRQVPVNLTHELSHIYNTFINKTEKKGIEFSIIEDDTDYSVLTDPVRLNQILTNLINNALKFTKSGAVTVIFNVEKIASDEIAATFKIKDTGIGIPPDKLNTIFESFSQVDNTSTKQYNGTGLGLAISQKLARLMGGSITVESQLGMGSVFQLNLKFKIVEKVKIITAPRKNSHQFESFKMLMAEDNEYNQLLSKVILEKLGAEVIIANNGQEAIDIAKKEKDLKLILMDIQMPVMNGIESMQNIKNRGITIPIIALTANALKGDREKFINEGFDEYLSKPFSQIELYSVLSKFIKLEHDEIDEYHINLSTEKLYNPSKLKSFCHNNEDFYLALLNKFTETTKESLENLTKYNVNLDRDKLSKISHKMLPSYNSLGIQIIVDDLRKLENEIGDLNDDEINLIVQLVISNSEKVLKEIEMELEDH